MSEPPIALSMGWNLRYDRDGYGLLGPRYIIYVRMDKTDADAGAEWKEEETVHLLRRLPHSRES